MLGLDLVDAWKLLQAHDPMSVTLHVWMSEITEAYLSRIHAGMARPGVIDVVRRLTELGIPQAAVSTAERRIAWTNLESIRLRHHMASVICREDVRYAKPHPAAYTLAVRRLGRRPDRCLAVEDTRSGLDAARRAGLVTIAWPHALSGALDQADADFQLAQITDFPWWPETSSNAHAPRAERPA